VWYYGIAAPYGARTVLYGTVRCRMLPYGVVKYVYGAAECLVRTLLFFLSCGFRKESKQCATYGAPTFAILSLGLKALGQLEEARPCRLKRRHVRKKTW
jgi:hypothetical protein